MNAVKFPLRLNMRRETVRDLQVALARRGLAVDDAEAADGRFGPSTRAAVGEFQRASFLPVTGDVDARTARALNDLGAAGGGAETPATIRVRGTLRDELGRPVGRQTVRVFRKTLAGEELLAEKTTYDNGFYDIAVPAPPPPAPGAPPASIVVRTLSADGSVAATSPVLFDPRPVNWVNFNLGGGPYLGRSAHTTLLRAVAPVLGGVGIGQITETPEDRQVSYLAKGAGRTTNDVMNLVLADRMAARTQVPAETWFAFLAQNLPARLPGDLLEATAGDFATADTLAEDTIDGIVFMDAALMRTALDKAIYDNLIPRQAAAGVEDIVDSLVALRAPRAAAAPHTVGKAPLSDVLASAAVPAATQRAFVERLVEHRGATGDFWATLAEAPGFDAATVSELRTTLDVGMVTKNHVPFLAHVKGEIGAGRRFASTRDLAKLDLDGWRALIDAADQATGGNAVPPNLDVGDDGDVVAVYATVLRERAEAMFPTTALVSRTAAAHPSGGELVTFVDAHPDLDLRTTSVDAFVTALDQPDGDVFTDPAAARTRLKTLQRALWLGGRPATAEALVTMRLHSAGKIASLTPQQFGDVAAPSGLGTGEVARIHAAATQVYAGTLARFGEFNPRFGQTTPAAIVATTAGELDLDEQPSLRTLFGGLDFCACEHCNSVLSPAAYLVDLLQFLGTKPAVTAGSSARDVLFRRRPDLGHLKLSCENTNTALPTIDVVCEILEDAVSASGVDHETGLASAELRAHPEHVNRTAYETLRAARFPMSAPFDLWLTEARAYLAHLGLARHDLQRTFRPSGAASPSDVDIAAERLGLSSSAAGLIVTPAPADQPVLWNTPDPATDLAAVELFLDRSRLSYDALLELLDGPWANPPGAARTVVERPADTCDVARQRLTNLGPARLDRFHRLVRLQRATGRAFWELDLLIRSPAVGAGTLNGACLVHVADADQLQRDLGLGTEELLACFADLNTDVRVHPTRGEQRPLYHRLFLDPTITRPTDPAFEPATMSASPTETIGAHAATVLAAAALGQADLQRLVARTDGHLTLANLSLVVRYATVARALRVSVADLLLIGDLRGVPDPFASLATLRALVDDVAAIRAARTTPAELDHVLRHAPGSPLGMSDALIAQHLTSLRDVQASIRAEYLAGGEDLATTLERGLQRFEGLADPAPAATLRRIVDGTWDRLADGVPFLTDAQRVDFLNARVVPFAGAEALTRLAALTQPPGPAREAEVSGRFTWALERLVDHLAASAVTEALGTILGVDDEASGVMATTFELPGASGVSLLQHLLDPRLTQTDASGAFAVAVTRTELPRLFDALTLLHKAASVVTRLRIVPTDLRWLVSHAAAFGAADLGALPVTAGQPPVAFAAWRALVDLLAFRARQPDPPDQGLFDVLDLLDSQGAGADRAAFLAGLAAVTGWDAGDLDALATRLGLAYPGAFRDVATYQRLDEAFRAIKLAGVAPDVLAGWAGADVSPEQATAVKQAAKSKYAGDQWLAISGALQDDVRERKREALVAHALAHPRPRDPADPAQGPAWDDENGLFAYFLVDVEISSCARTSRVQQALASIQLFVQRCLLNLERHEVVAGPGVGWEQWKWMKQYRIWEANRKVFLYPENWIEPELRDDKSPFFSALEADLQQDEVTDASVERAMRNYLARLDGVSRLEVVGTYHHVGTGVDDLHVLARTRQTPRAWFHRVHEDGARWTAWTPIDVEIDGEQVVPVVVNRRLHLFWLVFREAPERRHAVPPTPPAVPTAGAATRAPEAPRHLEIQLAWTMLDNGAWTGKRLSRRTLIHPWLRPEATYHLRTRFDGLGRLNLDVHLNSSREFNGTEFYNPFTATWGRLTDTPFDVNEWPWHSSTFVFDGDVSDVLLNDINGSLALVAGYGAEGRATRRLSGGSKRPRLKQPVLMHFEHGRLVNQDTNASSLNVLVGDTQRVDDGQLLSAADAPFSLIVAHQDYQFDSATRPFFFQDARRSYFVTPTREWQHFGSFTTAPPSDPSNPYRVRYSFAPFFHPYTALMVRELDRGGVEGVLNRALQLDPASVPPATPFSFNATYGPRPLASAVSDGDVMDFSAGGSYSQYNWELFFHLPLLVADRLRRNQRFEEALRWFHFVFDPTNASSDPAPKRFWITKPFHDYNGEDYQAQRIERLLELVHRHSPAHESQVQDWRDHPFQPHRVARLRPVAYQRTVVMKYLDNLVEWGDQRFRQDTLESINEATQLYVLAAEILGPRPRQVPPAARAEDKTYLELLPDLDAFSNAMAEVENVLGAPVHVVAPDPAAAPLPPPETFYFCVPHNDRLLRYWDTVADRLFKIRHCMNIEGLRRALPLFEPPIDPALLVKAAAAGVDLGSVLSDVDAALPLYRFPYMLQRAYELAGEIRQLGAAILAALEKRDAETLAALRSTHEVSVYDAMVDVRDHQIAEAEKAQTALERARAVVEARLAHYEAREYMNSAEHTAAGLAIGSLAIEGVMALGYVLAGALKLIPSFTAGASGFGGSPHVVVEPVNGDRIGDAAEAAVKAASAVARALDKGASLAATYAAYDRRAEEWDLQKVVARAELAQLDAQLQGAAVRVEIARAERRVLEVQRDNARAADEFMRSKYTGVELYDWTLSQLSGVYFQAYQLAYDVAKRAERAFRFDLGLDDSSYIRFGYWDSLKKGLLAGEKLSLDLRKLDSAYVERNRRELELTKHVSLAQLAPGALLALRATGRCSIELPELLFDMDYPGHYLRRIKTVSLSIPCVTGPYTGIHCTLTLLRNALRTSNLVGGDGYARVDADDARFRDQRAAVQSIATSHGREDSGLFTLDFRDERYLPFEGAGAISEWQIDLPKDTNRFDFDTISDVVLHLRYTARDGGEALGAAALDDVRAALPTAGTTLLDLRRVFPHDWQAFLHPPGAGDEQVLRAELTADHFPFFARGSTIAVTRFELVGELSGPGGYEVVAEPANPGVPLAFARTAAGDLGDLHHLTFPAPDPATGTAPELAGGAGRLGEWTFRIRRAGVTDFASLDPDEITQLHLLLHHRTS